MKHGWKKTLSLMLVLVFTASLIAACTGNNGNTETASNNADNGESTTDSGKGQSDGNQEKGQAETAGGFEKGHFDPPVEIRTMSCSSTLPLREGETIEDNWHTQWAEEELGINLKYDWVSQGDACEEKVRLTMSANQPLPDVFAVFDKPMLGELMESGKLMDVTEAFNQYASDEVKTMYADPSVWLGVSKDGKRLGIPILTEAMNGDPVMWIRQDWMNELGMDAPQNFDELEALMAAMLETDFNGNGKQDPPLALSMKDDWYTWMADASWIFGGYGVIPGFWNTWGGDSLEYGSIRPETKDALAKLQDWFKKGYISQDVGLLDARKASEVFTSESAGIIAGPKWMGGWPIEANLIGNNPEAMVKSYPIPAGPTGEAGRQGSSKTNGALVVTKDFEHMDALMLYINKLVEYSNPEKGSPYENGFKEGYDYVMKNGEVSRARADFPNEQPLIFSKYSLSGQPWIDPSLKLEAHAKFYSGGKPSTPYEEQEYAIATDEQKQNPQDFHTWRAAQVVLSQKEASIEDMFKAAPTETMVQQWEALKKLEQETFLKIIYNQAPISEFDSFVEKWKEMGGDKITEEVNAWYDSAMGR